MIIKQEMKDAATLVAERVRQLNSAVQACARLKLEIDHEVRSYSEAHQGVKISWPIFFISVKSTETL